MSDSSSMPAGQNASSETSKKFRCAVRSHDNPSKLEVLELLGLSRQEVITELQSKNYLVISVRETEDDKLKISMQHFLSGTPEAKTSAADKGKFFSRLYLRLMSRVSNRELIGFVVQLSALLRSGIPLLQSLKIVERGTQNAYFKKILNEIIEDVKQGFSFHYAISKHGKVFPSILPNLIEVGEISGNLVEVLDEIARYQEASARMVTKVITAFFYPSILLLLASGAVIFLLLEIIPKFEVVFTNLRIQLPLITQIVMLASKVLRNYGPIVWGILALLIIAIRMCVRSPKGKFFMDEKMLKIPVLGTLFLQVAIVRFSRGFGTMLHAGIPLLSCLKLSAKLTANAFIMKIFDDIHENVQSGHGLGLQLEKSKVFPPFMTSLISVGEESGELVHFLKLIGDYYEERVDTFLSRMGSILEPVLLVFVGAVIGVIVISVFLPLMEISTMGGR